MKGKRYTITVYESAIDISHGFGMKIKEICLENGVTINDKSVFMQNKKSADERMNDDSVTEIEDIEMDFYLSNLFTKFAKQQSIVKREQNRILKLKKKTITVVSTLYQASK